MPFEQEYVAHSFMINLEKNGFSLGEFLEANQERKNEIFAILGANNPNQLKLDFPEEKFDEEAYKQRALNSVTAFKKKTDAAMGIVE